MSRKWFFLFCFKNLKESNLYIEPQLGMMVGQFQLRCVGIVVLDSILNSILVCFFFYFSILHFIFLCLKEAKVTTLQYLEIENALRVKLNKDPTATPPNGILVECDTLFYLKYKQKETFTLLPLPPAQSTRPSFT